jgi:ATP-dependent DNA ligase
MGYYAFDLLFLEGKDLRQQPLSARRKYPRERDRTTPGEESVDNS